MSITGIVIGPLVMGRVEQVAGCSVATRFWMINGVPLRPLDSFIDQASLNGGPPIPIPRHRGSVLAGLARPWSSIAAVLTLLAGAVASPYLIAPGALLALFSGYLWLGYGQLSAAEKRRRLAYAVWVGSPFDPLHLAPDTELSASAALVQIVEERTAQAPGGYREKSAEPWRAVAPDSDDPELLIAALCRARLEQRAAVGPAREELERLHAAIWARLDPLLLAGKAPQTYLDWQAHLGREETRGRKQLRALAALAALGAVALAVAVPVMLYQARPALVIANVSGTDGMTVLLDGEPVARELPTARDENDAAFVHRRLRDGTHELVTRDARGAELDRRRFAVTRGQDGGFLYAPAAGTTVCFYQERLTYAESEARRAHEMVRLQLDQPLHRFSRTIDHWFVAPPQSIEGRNRGDSVERRAVRAAPCSMGAIR